MPTLDLVNGAEIQRQLGIGEKKLRDLRAKRLIPFTKVGYRTIRYSVSSVQSALARQAVQAVSA
jgi:hypothetical protein